MRSSNVRRSRRKPRPNFVDIEADDVELRPKMSAEFGEILRCTIAGLANFHVGLIMPRPESIPSGSRGGARPEDGVGLQLCEFGTKRPNFRHRNVAGGEAQCERMLIGNDTPPRVLSTRNKDHGAGLCEVAVNRDGPSFRTKTRNKAAGVIHREMEARQQGLGM